MIHTVKGFGIVNKAEIDAFLELSCLFDDPADVGNLISDSSAFSKTSLNIWKFSVHILLKPGLENFEHYFASKVMLKILQVRVQQYMYREFQIFKLDLEKAEEPEIILPASTGSWKKQKNSRNTTTSAY